MRLSLLLGFWSSRELLPGQRKLVEDALRLTKHLEVLGPKLQEWLLDGSIRANSSINVRALCKTIPMIRPSLEINFDLLVPPNFDPHLMRQDFKKLEPAVRARKLAWLDSRMDEVHLGLAALLVHEGTHLMEGWTWSRRDDEVKAYHAERGFLRRFVDEERYRKVAQSLLADLAAAAKMEGLPGE